MKQPAQNNLSVDQSGQALAWLTSLFALALDLANPEAASDELRQVGATYKHLPPGLTRPQVEPVFIRQRVDRLGLDQRDVAGFGVFEVVIPFEALSGMCDSGCNLVRQSTALGGQVDRLDCALLSAHDGVYCRA